jgi:hypothetical protein
VNWRDFASCAADDDPDCWDMSAEQRQRVHALAVCLACPVYGPCLEDAKLDPPKGLIQAAFGWYGGREPVNVITGERIRSRSISRISAYPAYSGSGENGVVR